MKTTRGFTLIELMVVVSVISMLSSIVLASIGPVRARARDSKRKQEVHQVDLAVQEYIADHGYPPEWAGCAVQNGGTIDPANISGCKAVSTQGLDGNTAWAQFATLIHPYMPNLPTDTCGSSCTADDGYSYWPPGVVQYYTGSSGSYQVSVKLEQGSSTGGTTGVITPPASDVPVITNLVIDGKSDSNGPVLLELAYDSVATWDASGALSCVVGSDTSNLFLPNIGRTLHPDDASGYWVEDNVTYAVVPGTVTITCYSGEMTGAHSSKTINVTISNPDHRIPGNPLAQLTEHGFITFDWTQPIDMTDFNGYNIYLNDELYDSTYDAGLVYEYSDPGAYCFSVSTRFADESESGRTTESCVTIATTQPVGNKPAITFSLTRDKIIFGSPITLKWITTRASSCSLTGPDKNLVFSGYYGPVDVNDQITLTLESKDSDSLPATLTLICSGPGGTSSANLTI